MTRSVDPNERPTSAARFTAVVMAGSRPGGDPLATALGVPHKALIPVAGVPMLARVVRTLRSSDSIGRVIICGLRASDLSQHPPLHDQLAAGEIDLLEGRSTPSTSALHALDQLGEHLPVLVTTADHPLLTVPIIDDFCDAATRADADVAVGFVSARLVQEAFPSGHRTFLRLRGDSYCSCNLFAFLTPSARRVPAFWAEIEQHRKQPWRMVRALGVGVTVRFLLRRLTLAAVMELASQRMGARVRAVPLAHPDAGFDVDKASDLAIADARLRRRERA